jgi:glycosyltransferase involved in cell wall biosynthesis
MHNRILFFTENHVFGGGNKYFVDLINSAPKDAAIHIVTNESGFFFGDRKRLQATAAVSSVSLFSNRFITGRKWPGGLTRIMVKVAELFLPLVFLLNVIRLVRRLQQHRPCFVVSSNGGYPGAESTMAMVVAAWLLRIPVLLSIVSMPEKRRKLLRLHDYLIDRMMARMTSAIVVNSKAQMEGLSRLRGFPIAKMVCIYNGIEDYIHKGTKGAVQPDGRLRLGYVGRLDKLKGVEYVLRAISVCESREQIQFIIVGNGPEQEHLVQLAESLGIRDQVQFKGFVPGHIAVIHQEFQVFVFPSLWEGLPYSILEAMRSGLPIISTNVGGIPEVIDHMDNGILVSPAEVDGLAEAIDYIAHNRSAAEHLSRNGRKKFEKEFTLQAMEEQFQRLIYPYLKPKTIVS